MLIIIFTINSTQKKLKYGSYARGVYQKFIKRVW